MKIPEKNIKYVDIPEVSEIYADTMTKIEADGRGARIEFSVTRMDDIKPPKETTAKRYPVCRLVLTPEAALKLHDNLQNIVNAMQKEGLIKRVEQGKGNKGKGH